MEFEPFVITIIIVMCFSGMIGTFIGVCLRLAWRAWLSRPKPLPIVGQEVVLELTPDGRYPPRREVKSSAEPAWTGCDQEEGFSMGTCFVCCDAAATMVQLNCGHGGLCRPCARHLWMECPHRCGLCRAPIVGMAHCLRTSAAGAASVEAVLCTTVSC